MKQLNFRVLVSIYVPYWAVWQLHVFIHILVCGDFIHTRISLLKSLHFHL